MPFPLLSLPKGPCSQRRQGQSLDGARIAYRGGDHVHLEDRTFGWNTGGTRSHTQAASKVANKNQVLLQDAVAVVCSHSRCARTKKLTDLEAFPTRREAACSVATAPLEAHVGVSEVLQTREVWWQEAVSVYTLVSVTRTAEVVSVYTLWGSTCSFKKKIEEV